MNRFILLSFFFFSTTFLFAQKVHQIELAPQKIHVPDRQFYVYKVLDNRLHKENIGVVQKGAFNKKTPADFNKKWTFELHLQDAFNRMMPFPEGKKPIVVSVKNLFISEKTVAFSEYGTAELTLEFLTKDAQLSYGEFSSKMETKGMEATKGHPKRILAALEDCILQFAKSDWQNKEPIAKVSQEELPVFDAAISLKSGLYRSFADFQNNNPTNDIPYAWKRIGKKVPGYTLIHKETKKLIKLPHFGASDGESVYLHASNYTNNVVHYYVKSHFLGAYIYFEDKFNSQLAGAAFGLIGSLASIKHTGIVLDTKTGMAMQLNETTMRQILKDHPDLLKKFEKSNKKRAANKQIILALNKRIATIETDNLDSQE